MPILNGQQFGELTRIIREAFSKSDLVQLVRIRMNDDLFGRISSDAKPLKDIAFDTGTKYEQEDRTAELLNALLAERPRNIDLRTLIATLNIPQQSIARPDTTGLPGDFGRGVAALPDAVRVSTNPRVSFAIGSLSGRLGPCRDQLQWLSRYKGLHDGLHQLQGKLTAIEITARNFALPPGPDGEAPPERAEARELLAGHAVELGRLVKSVQDELDPEPPLPTQAGEAEWAAILANTVKRFEDAVGNDDTRQVTDAVVLLRGLVRQAAVVNDHLLFLVRGLRLSQLSTDMKAVDKALGAAGGAAVVAFRTGLDAIGRLGPDLTALVEEHNGWQELEAGFALAATQAQAPPADRFADWPAAKAKLAALCAVNRGDALAERVTTAAGAYDGARTGPKADAERAFVSVRLAFTKMFFQVDGRLLDLARQLAAQAEALDTAAHGLANVFATPTS